MDYTYKFSLDDLRSGEERELYGAEGITLSACGEDDCVVLRLCKSCEAVYGLGERFDRVNQKGFTVRTEVMEKFCNQGEVSYCPVPFFYLESGAGMYIDTLTVVEFSFEMRDQAQIRVGKDSRGRFPEVYLFLGTPREILESFSRLTGRPRRVPKWSLGPWMSANRWDTQKETRRQLHLAKEYGFPHTVLVLEAWSDEATFYRFNDGGQWEDPAALIRELHVHGIHLILWQIPVLKKLQEGENHPVLEEDWTYAMENGLCIKNRDGSCYRIPEDHWFPGSLLPDFTNPETVKWWFEKRRHLLSMGVDGFKTDGGEFILRDDAVAWDGRTSLELRNAYASEYVRAYADFVGEDRILFSRAGYTGQQKAPIQWAGDQMSTWEELRHVMTAGLSIGLSGIPLWGFDIGGFAGPLPEPELYERAVQMAAFVPVMQWHSELVGGQFAERFPAAKGINDRSPWNISDCCGDRELLTRLRFWFRLRMNLLPYLYQQSIRSAESGLPMMRHPVIDYPGDRNAALADDCFLLGDLLVAPILEKGREAREVYLPGGTWSLLWPMEVSGEDGRTPDPFHLEGGKTCRVRCGMDRIPVFVRHGGCVALHLGEELCLGSDVGNGMDAYRNLCFYPAGREGEYFFQDDLGNEILLRWKDGHMESRRAAGETAYRILGESDLYQR